MDILDVCNIYHRVVLIFDELLAEGEQNHQIFLHRGHVELPLLSNHL